MNFGFTRHWAWMVVLCGGCASYQYNIVQPAEFTAQISPGREATFKIDPLQYHLLDYDNRLVVEIANPTGDRIDMVQNKSLVIDVDGPSHPLRGQIIPANDEVRVIFPPMKAAPLDTPPAPPPAAGTFGSPNDQPGQLSGPTVGLGGEAFNPNKSNDDDEFHRYDWDWNNEGSVKVHLVFKQGEKMFVHDFVFARVRK